MSSYPLPTANDASVQKVIDLYEREYQVQLTYDEAKRFLEGVMHFIYLTEVEGVLRDGGVVLGQHDGLPE